MDFTALYCDVDDFVKNHEKISLPSENTYISNKTKCSMRKSKLSNSEVMTICIAYHQSGYKNLKAFYWEHLMKYQRHAFPDLVSYTGVSPLNFLTVSSLTLMRLSRTRL